MREPASAGKNHGQPFYGIFGINADFSRSVQSGFF
jgi:hypothetical protein